MIMNFINQQVCVVYKVSLDNNKVFLEVNTKINVYTTTQIQLNITTTTKNLNLYFALVFKKKIANTHIFLYEQLNYLFHKLTISAQQCNF